MKAETPLSKPTFVLALFLVSACASAADVVADPPKHCDACEGWSATREPFAVFGNTWFVGGGLSSVLITSTDGHVLIDGGLPQSAPAIAANIRKLGFRIEDVKLLLNSHTHYDHAGGLAALQRASGAAVAASPAAKRALEKGGPTPDDPQFAFGPVHNDYAAVSRVRAVRDGETVNVGPISLKAHFTPGHTPGGTSWTWRSCEGDRCLDMVYADSLNAVSAPGFRFSGDGTHASRVQEFQKSMDKVAALRCDILLAPHPELIDLDAKLAARAQDPTVNPFVDSSACRKYAAAARGRLDKRLLEERATP